MAEDTLAVSVNIFTEDQTKALRAVEVLSLAAAGLALEGIRCSLNIDRIPDDEDGE